MSSLAIPDDDLLSAADLEQVIAVCERFEEAWKVGRQHRIEDLQSVLAGSLRPRLFRELIALELELRLARGERPGQEEYRARFPDQAGTIGSVFAGVEDVRPWPSQPSSSNGTPGDDLCSTVSFEPGLLPARSDVTTVCQLSTEHDSFPSTVVAFQTDTSANGQTTDQLDAATWRECARNDTTEGFGQTSTFGELPGKADAGAGRPPAWYAQPFTPTPAGSSTWIGSAGYEIIGEIGRGGMGVVYKARHRGLKRLVALKLIRGDARANPDLLGRLQTEAETIARLHHENIVQVYDVGEMNGDPYVALELLEGGTLAAKLAGTPQPNREAAEICRTLALAMHAAHQVGVVHRDLKPLNVLLDDSGRLKIADFGLAKRLEVESGQTQSGQIIGTPSYMAPEQARGHVRAIGPAADVYALGAILYEMLTGRPPFKGPTPLETVRQVTHDDPVPPSRLQSRVSADLETICLKCLAKEPHSRYTSAADLAEDLDRYLDGQPIRARRAGISRRGLNWARRHPMAATWAALGISASLALTATGLWYQDHLRRRDRFDSERLAVRLSDGTSKFIIGQSELVEGKPDEAKLTLSNLLTEIKDEPQRLADLRGRALALLTQVDAAIARARADAARRMDLDRARERYRRFLAERDSALYHATQFAGLDPSSSRDSTRASAEAALAVFGTPLVDGAWSLNPLPGSLSEAEQRDVKEGCYVLLLILAGLEDRPEQGLLRLTSAAMLYPPTRASQRLLADCLARQGSVVGVEKARREAERLAPSTSFDHFITGLEQFGRREWAAALSHFDASLRLQPDHFWANALAAVCCLQPGSNRAERAQVHLGACLQREPGLPWLHLLRGFASYQAAVLALHAGKTKTAQGNPTAMDVLAMFEPAEADYRTAEDLLASTPNAELHYILLVNRALLRLEQSKWDGAIRDLEAAIRLDVRHYLAYANLAQVYQRQDKPAEAVAQFSRAIAVKPDMPALYRGRAEVELNRKETTPDQRRRALADLDKAIRLEVPGNPVIARDQTNRGLLFFQEQDNQQTLAACDAALAVVPEHPDAQLLRIRALLELKRYDDALLSCTALLARGKPSAEVYDMRRLARERLDDFAGAIEDVTQALSLRPAQLDLLVRRGELYLMEDSPSLALGDFEKAVQLNPLHADARVGLGAARVRLGRYGEAVVDAEAAARLGAGDHRVLYKAARVYALASVAATFEVRRKGRDAVVIAMRYQDRAVELIRAARLHVPAAGRANFEAVLQNDPAISNIRRRLRLSGPPRAANSNSPPVVPAGIGANLVIPRLTVGVSSRRQSTAGCLLFAVHQQEQRTDRRANSLVKKHAWRGGHA
jgi:serine/threonine protein kinase/tetratricopeptide (TPR) repeat protein